MGSSVLLQPATETVVWTPGPQAPSVAVSMLGVGMCGVRVCGVGVCGVVVCGVGFCGAVEQAIPTTTIATKAELDGASAYLEPRQHSVCRAGPRVERAERGTEHRHLFVENLGHAVLLDRNDECVQSP